VAARRARGSSLAVPRTLGPGGKGHEDAVNDHARAAARADMRAEGGDPASAAVADPHARLDPQRVSTEILAHHDAGAINGPTVGLNLCVKKVK